MRHHQVRLQLVVAPLRPFLAQRTARRQVCQRVQLLCERLRRRIAYQPVIRLPVPRHQGRQQRGVMVQPEALIPGRAMRLLVL